MRIFDLVMDTGIPSNEIDCLTMFRYGLVRISGQPVLDIDTNIIPGNVFAILEDVYIYRGIDDYSLIRKAFGNRKRMTTRVDKIGEADD